MNDEHPRSISIIKATIVVVLLSTQTACAAMVSGAMNASVTEDEVRTKTAQYFSVAPDKVLVTNIAKGLLATEYKAMVADEIYNCQMYYGAVSCKKPGA